MVSRLNLRGITRNLACHMGRERNMLSIRIES